MTDLAQQIKALAEKATEGPWNVDGPPNNQIIWASPEVRVCFMAHSDGKDEERDIATAALIVILRNNLPQILTALSEAERMREAGQAVIAQAFDHYTARNGRRIGIEGDDGEKCWIVPFDAFESLRAAIGGE